MDKILNEQTTQKEAHTTVSSENVNGAPISEVSLGKFKDVNALLSAYNSLESEFTKRCQKIKELEERVKAVDKDQTPTTVTIESVEDETKKSITQEEKEEILKGYLREILSSKSKAIVLDDVGTGVKSPTNRPKTIEQAGQLAKEFLSTKK